MNGLRVLLNPVDVSNKSFYGVVSTFVLPYDESGEKISPEIIEKYVGRPGGLFCEDVDVYVPHYGRVLPFGTVGKFEINPKDQSRIQFTLVEDHPYVVYQVLNANYNPYNPYNDLLVSELKTETQNSGIKTQQIIRLKAVVDYLDFMVSRLSGGSGNDALRCMNPQTLSGKIGVFKNNNDGSFSYVGDVTAAANIFGTTKSRVAEMQQIAMRS